MKSKKYNRNWQQLSGYDNQQNNLEDKTFVSDSPPFQRPHNSVDESGLNTRRQGETPVSQIEKFYERYGENYLELMMQGWVKEKEVVKDA